MKPFVVAGLVAGLVAALVVAAPAGAHTHAQLHATIASLRANDTAQAGRMARIEAVNRSQANQLVALRDRVDFLEVCLAPPGATVIVVDVDGDGNTEPLLVVNPECVEAVAGGVARPYTVREGD
jgi:hypothetical protein